MNHKFFENKSCKYYPCHKGLKKINCLFCYCPLYFLQCDGNYKITESGIKNCSNCNFPHIEKNYNKVIKKLCCRSSMVE